MFDTGEFSRLAQVSKRTLRYYHSIGLLTPMDTDPVTGTRFYSASQFADVNRIVALKDLGLSLAQIQRIVADDVSHDEILGMLRLRHSEVEQNLIDERRRLSRIEARLKDPVEYLDEAGVVTKQVDQQWYLCHRTILTPDNAMEKTLAVMTRVPALAGPERVSHFVSVMHGDGFDETGADAEIGYLLDEPDDLTIELADGFVLTERLLPAVVEMASVVVVGGPTRYPAGFNELGRWADSNGVRLGGPQREVFLDAPLDGDDTDMVIEIQLPIIG